MTHPLSPPLQSFLWPTHQQLIIVVPFKAQSVIGLLKDFRAENRVAGDVDERRSIELIV